MARFRRSNPLALAVLVALFDADRHPYEIARTLRKRQHDRSMRLNFGSLYGVVRALERSHLIEIVDTERAGSRPERTVYRVTDAGRDEARSWLVDLLARPEKEYLAFEAALTLIAALDPDEATEALGWRLQELEQTIVIEATAVRAGQEELGLPRVFLLEAEYDLAIRRAEAEFVRQLVAEMRSGQFPGLEAWRSHTLADFELDPTSKADP